MSHSVRSPFAVLLSTVLATTAYAQEQVPTQSVQLDSVVVTSSKEAKPQSELAESVGVLDEATIKKTAPSHPSEITNRVAGVHVNSVGGEGHMTAIRQPITTSGVYLFLEDNLPTRPTGFFNHNGLYELNIPQAAGLEITKGPGSALYGSDAIGGMINSLTKAPSREKEASVNVEGGSFGWARLLASGSGAFSKENPSSPAARLDFNATQSKGFRDETAYDRISATGRVDGYIGETLSYKVIMSGSDINQSGNSALNEADFRDTPEKNLYHNGIAYRKVSAQRLSSEFVKDLNNNRQLTVTPFVRNNKMDLMPSWMVTYDPNIAVTEFQSYGLMTKYREKMPDMKLEVIAGIDFDYTPSKYKEDQITVTKTGDIYTDYAFTGRTNYDYEAKQSVLSPYLQGEWLAQDNLRLIAGARFDNFSVDYHDNLDSSVPEVVGGKKWYRPDSQEVNFSSFSPKLGLVWNALSQGEVYINHRYAFRAPSVGQLFRSGSSQETDKLKPVHSVSTELGFRGKLLKDLRYDFTVYDMTITDDVVTYIDGATRMTTNAGKTQHRGFELSLQSSITETTNISAAWTVTDQKYVDFQALKGATNINYAGYRVARAPREMGSLAVGWNPAAIKGLSFELQWEKMGSYFTDETNTYEYAGHDLFNLRTQYKVSESIAVQFRALNLADRLYSVNTSNAVGSTQIDYMPGNPRSYYVGLTGNF